ncbi:MAG: hypothetical protein ABH827_01835 [bacterium]
MMIRTKNILLALALTACSIQMAQPMDKASQTDINQTEITVATLKCAIVKNLKHSLFAEILAIEIADWQDNDDSNRLNKLEKIVQKEAANLLNEIFANKLQQLNDKQKKLLKGLIAESSKTYARFFVKYAKDNGIEYYLEKNLFTDNDLELLKFIKKCINSVSKNFLNMLEFEAQDKANNDIEPETPKANRTLTCPGTPIANRAKIEQTTPHINGDKFIKSNRVCQGAPRKN